MQRIEFEEQLELLTVTIIQRPGLRLLPEPATIIACLQGFLKISQPGDAELVSFHVDSVLRPAHGVKRAYVSSR